MNWYQQVNYTVGKVDEQGHLESSDATTGKVIEGRKDVTPSTNLKNNQYNLRVMYMFTMQTLKVRQLKHRNNELVNTIKQSNQNRKTYDSR